MAEVGASNKRTALRLGGSALLAIGIAQLAPSATPSRAADNSAATSAAAPNPPTASPSARSQLAPDDSSVADFEPPPTPDALPPVSYHPLRPGTGYGPEVGTVKDFLMEGIDNASPLGFALQPDRRQLNSGEAASGLIVVSVTPGGPAAKAGLRPYRNRVKKTIEFASIAAAFFFPPTMMLLPIVESSHAGDSYDMIIGIDGFRVCNILDFEDGLRDAQPGQIVYLSVIRDGSRMQLPVTMPDFTASPQ
jgi:hypothetical protein